MKETKFRKIFFNYFTLAPAQFWDSEVSFTDEHLETINKVIKEQLDQFIEHLAYRQNLIEPLESIEGLSGEEEQLAIKALKADLYKQEKEKIQ